LRRIILASSKPNDIVLDPFLGSGTTAAVAKQLHRNWIGIERDEIYIKAAQARIDAISLLPFDNPLIEDSLQEKPIRVPFVTLIENHYLHPGQQLFLDGPDCTAIILNDGNIQANGLSGSIHRVGAQIKMAPSCNGWEHWFYLDELTGERKPINYLRNQVRQKINEVTS
jgi:modification methylase